MNPSQTIEAASHARVIAHAEAGVSPRMPCCMGSPSPPQTQSRWRQDVTATIHAWEAGGGDALSGPQCLCRLATGKVWLTKGAVNTWDYRMHRCIPARRDGKNSRACHALVICRHSSTTSRTRRSAAKAYRLTKEFAACKLFVDLVNRSKLSAIDGTAL